MKRLSLPCALLCVAVASARLVAEDRSSKPWWEDREFTDQLRLLGGGAPYPGVEIGDRREYITRIEQLTGHRYADALEDIIRARIPAEVMEQDWHGFRSGPAVLGLGDVADTPRRHAILTDILEARIDFGDVISRGCAPINAANVIAIHGIVELYPLLERVLAEDRFPDETTDMLSIMAHSGHISIAPVVERVLQNNPTLQSPQLATWREGVEDDLKKMKARAPGDGDTDSQGPPKAPSPEGDIVASPGGSASPSSSPPQDRQAPPSRTALWWGAALLVAGALVVLVWSIARRRRAQ